ncbi:MAG: hypothetical protein AB7G13_35760, partial [Lautropia sp.]
MEIRTPRLQRRIAFALTVVVALFVVVQGYLAYSALEQQEDDLVDQIVENEGRQLVDRNAAGEHVQISDGKPRDQTTR